MSTITQFEEIHAWQTARDLANLIYQISSISKFNKDFGLRDQIRRASISVMSNIAEGFESQTKASFIRYLWIAKASAGEVRSHLYLALDQGYLSKDEFSEAMFLVKKASSQIFRFLEYLKKQC